MSGKDVSNDVLKLVKKSTGKSVSKQQINKLATGVNASTLKSEKQLRDLINQVSKMVNVPVSEATKKNIISAVKKSNINASNLEQLMKMIGGGK